MNLLQIRKDFIEATGRNDLVVDLSLYVDKGANEFIRRGQRMLDRMPFEGKNEEAVLSLDLAAGQHTIQIPSVRAVKEVWIVTTTGTYPLRKMDLADIQYDLGINSFGLAQAARGSVQAYAPMSMRSIGLPTTSSETGRGLLLFPPSDRVAKLNVRGLFLSAPLVNDASVSFWTVAHPETLVQAAWYMLERFYRNSEGMKDHLEAIDRDLRGIDMDHVEEIATGIDEMRDSWRDFDGH